jgi:hypothetical protein
LDICIHNKGTSLSKNVNVCVYSDYPYIEFIRDSANYRDISAGCYKSYYQSVYSSSNTGTSYLSNVSYNLNSSSYVPFVFKATSSFEANNVIPISIIITDDNGNEFVETFNLNEN